MRQKKKLKKALSLLLTAAMVLSLNVPVFADEADDGNGEDNATNSVQVLDATDGEDVPVSYTHLDVYKRQVCE